MKRVKKTIHNLYPTLKNHICAYISGFYITYIFNSIKAIYWGLGGPVAGTPCSQCEGPGFSPWSGYYIPQAATKTQQNQINKLIF